MARLLVVSIWLLAAGAAGGAGVRASPATAVALPRPDEHPSLELHAKLEKTIFKVDVLTLDLWLGPETARRIAPWLPAAPGSAAADSVADIAMHSRDAWARITMRRDVSLDRFVSGVADNMRKARDAGIILPATYETVRRGLPEWFAPLRERGFLDGDRILYRIRDDSLRTVVQEVSGPVVVDVTHLGAQRRLTLLGSFLVRGSDFRKQLLGSLPDSLPRN